MRAIVKIFVALCAGKTRNHVVGNHASETKSPKITNQMNTSKITNCYEIKDALKSRGWKFNSADKSWEKAGEWTTPAEVEAEVRKYAGVRNRNVGRIEVAVSR